VNSGKAETLPKVLDVVRLYSLNHAANGFEDIIDLRMDLSSKSMSVAQHTVLLLPAVSN